MGEIIFDGEGYFDKAKKWLSHAANFLGLDSQYLEKDPMRETDYHVVHIDFAMKDIGMTKTLFKMSTLREEI